LSIVLLLFKKLTANIVFLNLVFAMNSLQHQKLTFCEDRGDFEVVELKRVSNSGLSVFFILSQKVKYKP